MIKNKIMKKNVLITGASKGLGKELALSLSQRIDIGTIVITARDQKKLEVTQNEILKINNNIRVIIVPGSFSNIEGILKFINDLKNLKVDFNIIINNAGTAVKEPLEVTPNEIIEEIIHVNLIAPILITKNFLSHLRKSNYGRIINISSISVVKPGPLISIYATTKSGLKTFSECMSLAEIKNGITCNTIMPGLILNDMGRKSIKVMFPEYNEQNASEIENMMSKDFPSGRFVTCTDVANVMNFLLSDEAGCISGEFFRVASGLL